MDHVRLGIIGCGGMGQYHMKYLAEVSRLKFVAACDTFQANVDKTVKDFGVQGYTEAAAMLASGTIDAVLIATPHYFHPQFSIAALEQGLHVLTEKPVAVTAQAAAGVEAVHAKNPKLKYAAMFQMRTEPRWRKVKELVGQGAVGAIQRVQWTATSWFRTQAYYDSGSWRATWAGEGGGVLLNQCPHNLDLLCWITGTPTKVHAHLGLGKHHRIEVEDDVTAFMEYANGATGVFIASTGEHPGRDWLEITGDRGRLTIIGGTNSIELQQTDSSVAEFCRTSKVAWSSPGTTKVTYEVASGGGHKLIMQNFVDAILDGVPLIAPAAEGLHSVELANAMIQSGITGKTVPLPMDRAGYEKLLADLIANSPKK